ncbi:DNA mismatch repair protein MutT [Clavibacter michiganensis]|uniref:DNA mismatch repair protein MutT n=1 Tax=Clavibacter michiganensis TaxID=28447 RepID=A0A2S5VY80_9MICO|nr:NUDIX domain-containing protein [Clavibacter michiganensis]PPF71009.1 DNA mismatch repair protein MutT [Clavibacter michiganensis]
MPASEYVRSLRALIGQDFLLLPGVTAVIQDDDRFLVARQRDSGRWSLVGGGVEPGEEPRSALRREVREELGVDVDVADIVGAYGGPALESAYPNGDRVGYVTIAYRCSLRSGSLSFDDEELLETRWVLRDEIHLLDRHSWIDQVVADASVR